jgi:hypothetical protein
VGVLVVVKGDAVEGTDKHNVSGLGPNPSPPPPPTVAYSGVGDFEYHGAVSDRLSELVQIGGIPVALVTSKSSLNSGEKAPPAGKHSGPQGSNFVPSPTTQAPLPTEATLSITDDVGTGVPSADAGSGLLTVGGVKVLLDGDAIDTCSGVGGLKGSTVTAEGQDFVSCSE